MFYNRKKAINHVRCSTRQKVQYIQNMQYFKVAARSRRVCSNTLALLISCTCTSVSAFTHVPQQTFSDKILANPSSNDMRRNSTNPALQQSVTTPDELCALALQCHQAEGHLYAATWQNGEVGLSAEYLLPKAPKYNAPTTNYHQLDIMAIHSTF